jgi:ATP-binding cassette subfamily B protein
MSESYHLRDEVQTRSFDKTLLNRLLTYLRPHRKWVIVSTLLLLAAACMSNLAPLLMMHAIDTYMNVSGDRGAEAIREDYAGLMRTTALLAGIIFLEAVVRFVQLLIVTWIGQRTMFEMRMGLFDHLQRLSLSFLDRNPVGRLMSRVTSDVDKIQESIVTAIVQVFSGLFTITVVLIFMFWTNWQLALVALVPLPLIFGASWVFRQFAQKSFLEIRRKVADIGAYMQESIGGIHVIQIFGQEGPSYARHDYLNAEHRNEWLRQVRNFAVYFPAVEFFSALSTALIIWYCGTQILNLGEEISRIGSVGLLVGYVYWAERLFIPIRALADRYNLLLEAMASSERVFELLDTRPEIVDSPDALAPDSIEGRVEFEKVWFAYNKPGEDGGRLLSEREDHAFGAQEEQWVLRDVSFSVAPGERVAIVGHTGAGKSTIINLISRFYEPQRGVIRIGGRDVRDYAQEPLRRHIGIVLQNVFLFNSSIEDNIRLADPGMDAEWVRECARRANADKFIQRLPGGYNYVVGERGANLSTGQRQLLAFARTLAHNPEILILDEATSSIDTETESLIQGAMETLMAGRTSIVIAHRLSTIRTADRILVMHHGEIREVGTHDELLAQGGLYSTLYELQFAGLQA